MPLFVKECTFEGIALLSAKKTFFPDNFISVSCFLLFLSILKIASVTCMWFFSWVSNTT